MKHFKVILDGKIIGISMVYPNTTANDIKNYSRQILLSNNLNPEDYSVSIFNSDTKINIDNLSEIWNRLTDPYIIFSRSNYLETMGNPFQIVVSNLNYKDMVSACNVKRCTVNDWRAHLNGYWLVTDIPNVPINEIIEMSKYLQMLEDKGIPKFPRTYAYHLMTIDFLKNYETKNKPSFLRYINDRYELKIEDYQKQHRIRNDLGLFLEDETPEKMYANRRSDLPPIYFAILRDNVELFLYFKNTHGKLSPYVSNNEYIYEEIYLVKANNIIRYLLSIGKEGYPGLRHPIYVYGLYFSPFETPEKFDLNIAKILMDKIPRHDFHHVLTNLRLLNKIIDVTQLINYVNSK